MKRINRPLTTAFTLGTFLVSTIAPRNCFKSVRFLAVFCVAIMLAGLSMMVTSPTANAQQTVTYTATQVIPIPPASNYQGSGGGDGWGIALNDDRVYNIFHHLSRLTIACHEQSDASSCWAPRTISGPQGNFNTSSHPGMYMDPADGKLYVYATQAADLTAGVVCIDTRSDTAADMFCGYTPLTEPGDARQGSTSGTSSLIEVAGKLYAFNFFTSSEAIGDRNTMMCYDLATDAPCPGQPFNISVGATSFTTSTFPTPAVALIGDQIIVPFEASAIDQLACFDTTTETDCAGSWPVSAPVGYASGAGAPFPLLSAAGATTGFCLPTGGDNCYELDGTPIPAPEGLTIAVPRTSQWSGEAVVLGTRVYVPNGSRNTVSCYDYGLNSGCAAFPKSFAGLSLLYSVNADPARPTCLWVNSDNGSFQIQNFDAFSGGACGDGPIRVLASASVVGTELCRPATFSKLAVLSPASDQYSSASVEFLDGSGQLIGVSEQPLDASGAVDLSPYGLDTVLGLPQFLITIDGAAAQQEEVIVELTWTGVLDESCVGPDTITSGDEPVDDNSYSSVALFTIASTGSGSVLTSFPPINIPCVFCDGHTWIEITRLDSGIKETYGTFGNLNPIGLYKDLELNNIAVASRSKYITQEELDSLYSNIIKFDRKKPKNQWSKRNNCASFATNIWKKIAKEKISAKATDVVIFGQTILKKSILFPYTSPTLVVNSIVEKNGGENFGFANSCDSPNC